MYYLEDKHPSKEYTLYVQVKGAVPYIGVWYATSMNQVYNKISEIEKRHKLGFLLNQIEESFVSLQLRIYEYPK